MLESIKNYEAKLKEMLSSKRFYHSLCVQKQAVILAGLLGADKTKASLAGLLHDVCKEWDRERQLQYLNSHDILLDIQTMEHFPVWHAITGSVFLEKEWNITDKEILGAVRWHTTGRDAMTLLEEIVFLADYTSEDRNYPDVEVVRELIPEHKNEAVFKGIAFGILKELDKEKPLILHGVRGYNFYISEIQKERKELGQLL